MNVPDVISRSLLAAWTVFLACGMSLSAEDDRLPGAAVPPAPRTHPLDDDVFDLWIFGGRADRFRQQLDEKLQQTVQDFDPRQGLSASEKQKLRLAGQVDIRRFFERTEQLRRKYHETRGNARELLMVHREAVAARGDALARLFDDRSFLAKVAGTMLAGDASRRIVDQLPRRRRSAAEQAVSPLKLVAELRPEQCEALVELLLEADLPLNGSAVDDARMKYRLTEIPEDRLRPLFDDEQWRRAAAVLKVYREYQKVLKEQRPLDDVTRRSRAAGAADSPGRKDKDRI